MTNTLSHQKRHVTLIRKPVELEETGFSVAEASGFSQKFNNGRVFIEVDIITKNKRILLLVNHHFCYSSVLLNADECQRALSHLNPM